MVRLLESPNATIELRRFLVYCTKENPCLIEDLLKLLTIPDPKNSFDYVSRASFIADLLSEGPSPLTCVSSMLGRENMCIRDSLSILLPVKLKGQFLAKALQNGNNLVRIESFKLIMIMLDGPLDNSELCRAHAERGSIARVGKSNSKRGTQRGTWDQREIIPR